MIELSAETATGFVPGLLIRRRRATSSVGSSQVHPSLQCLSSFLRFLRPPKISTSDDTVQQHRPVFLSASPSVPSISLYQSISSPIPHHPTPGSSVFYHVLGSVIRSAYLLGSLESSQTLQLNLLHRRWDRPLMPSPGFPFPETKLCFWGMD